MARRPTSKKLNHKTSSEQLTFDFGKAVDARVTLVETAPPSKLEVMARPLQTLTNTMPTVVRHAQADGAEENKYLLHQADKYEDRAMKALIVFIGSACLTILAKSGLPVTALSEKIGIPPVANIRLLCGMLTAANILFTAALIYFALRIRQHTPQLRLRLVECTWSGYIAQYMLWLCGTLVAATLLAVLMVGGRDLIFMMTYVVDRQFYILDGWEAVRR